MYNILLTDDEQIVIDSLTIILNKNFQDQVNIFHATSGTDALEIVKTSKIDIIFMDIHMPGLSGLDTISLIKQINQNIIIVILSAYDQFQYAQEAMNLGAYKYLTKPVNRNLIIQTVRNCMNQVDSHRGQLTEGIELHQKLNLVSTMVESDFIYSCIFNNSNTDFSEYLSYFGLSKNSSFFMSCIELSGISQEKRYDVYVKVRDVLTSKCRCIIGSFMTTRIGVFFPITQRDANTEINEVRDELIKNIFTLLTTKISANIKLGVSEIENQIEKAQTAYNNALSAINQSIESGLYFYNKGESLSSDDRLIEKTETRFLARIRAGDTTSINQLANEYITNLSKVYQGKTDRIKSCIFEFLINAKREVLELDSNYKNEAFDEAFSKIAGAENNSDLEKFLCDRTIECTTAINQLKTAAKNPIISKAQNFIQEHLAEDLGLEQIASILGVSPFYLSKLFKEETGETLINHITTLRLEKAKQLLGNDSMIIKEITAATGYNDQNYFSKLFKQKYGLSPSEYRDSLKAKN